MPYNAQFEQWQDQLAYLSQRNIGGSLYENERIDPQNLFDQGLTPEEALTRCITLPYECSHCTACQ